MTQAELYQALKTIGYPVAYGSFSSPVTPPFITYQFAYNSDLIADNQNYVEISNFQVELYTNKKDLNAEKLVQDKLKELGLPYRKFETFLDTENLYQILYEIQILGG
ncbi:MULTISPECIES: hypothetical protein [unclassified Geobacillus]|uniref:hypothetical protein n=1 Tax=unclassified Geobacillus TaxID=2642459 RepID=UPI000D377328|nr:MULTISPECIES: hypothetical protein [unclassified Geobacillus]PUF85761.1 hypothetical protein DCC82_15465 [Geobacillus sp. LYN3]TXK89069.1 hypothetical protein FVE68_01650 [Geobacillus sp. AYS3]